ncbi:MAG: glycosyltransferase family 2 protein [Tumebacillaceae bacterium]
MSSYNGNLYTLRAPSGELLPRTTIFVYGTDRFLLSDTLRSVARRTDYQLEVIVLHDGPVSPATYRTLAEAPASLPLRLLETEQPRGPARAVNAMLMHLESDYVLILEAGDTLQTNLDTMTEELLDADEETLGVYGDMELGSRLLHGESSASPHHLLALLHEQTRIAPPLLRLEALLDNGRLPTDYPSEGWMLPDTALVLHLLDTGRLSYVPNILISRPPRPLDAHQKRDERALLNLLLRRTAKRCALSFPCESNALRTAPERRLAQGVLRSSNGT